MVPQHQRILCPFRWQRRPAVRRAGQHWPEPFLWSGLCGLRPGVHQVDQVHGASQRAAAGGRLQHLQPPALHQPWRGCPCPRQSCRVADLRVDHLHRTTPGRDHVCAPDASRIESELLNRENSIGGNAQASLPKFTRGLRKNSRFCLALKGRGFKPRRNSNRINAGFSR